MPRPSFAPAGRSRCWPAAPRRGEPPVSRSTPAWGSLPASPTMSRCRPATGRRLSASATCANTSPGKSTSSTRSPATATAAFTWHRLRIGGNRKMRLSHLICSLAALGLAMARPVDAEETVNGPLYTVVYFEVDPTEAPQTAAAARQYAEASGKENGNLGFEMFQEIARPSRFAVVEVWRDKNAAEAHGKAAAATALVQKVQPTMIDGFGARPHSAFDVAAPKGQIAAGALYVVTHVDVFPTGKDQAAELVKAQAEAARKD